jgi:YbbR domain-containing protein
MEKRVPVRISVIGKPDDSYFVDDTIATPSSVTICGPETAVETIDEISTKPVDCSGRSASFKKEIAPDLKDGVKVCSKEGIILAEIYLAEKVVTRRFLDLLVEGRNTPLDYRITPRTLTLEIKGPQNILSNLEPQKDIRVSVELTNLKPGVYVRRAVISLPVKTTLVNVEPELFTVKISDQKP